MARRTRTRAPKSVESITHEEAKRRNLPSAEHQPLMGDEERSPVQVAYERRNRDLDPQLVWRGKDEQDWSDLVVNAPPLYIQERVHPKALVDDLMRSSQWRVKSGEGTGGEPSTQLDLFSDFNGLPSEAAKTEFYQHDANWSNRMVLGDSLQVMASLAEREGLRGKVQCIYIDPPYGIKFNSNFQWSTTSRDVRDGNAAHITREPEQVKAFRDTWRDGIHSYLTYLRDRLTVARDLLTDSGSIFVQIGDENVHRIRALMDEVFGDENFVSLINYTKTTGFSGNYLSSVSDYILWYGKSIESLKYRSLYSEKQAGEKGATRYRPISSIMSTQKLPHKKSRLATSDQMTSQGEIHSSEQEFYFQSRTYLPSSGLHWKTTVSGLERLNKASRIIQEGNSIRFVRFIDDFAVVPSINVWLDIGGVQSRTDPKVYVVQTATEAIKRCILMTTDPGDLVLDPTCGAGTTAYVAEQWGRRWITIDTSRVALALARARIMGARYPYYLLSDSREGQLKEADITGREPSERGTFGDVRQGFVYERVPHITLRDIANNAEIDVIWESYEEKLAPLRERLSELVDSGEWRVNSESGGGNSSLATNHSTLEEWEIPRDLPDDWPDDAGPIHEEFWETRIARQKEIDASIARNAEFEYLYDKPYEDRRKARVAGPFTVESISPHRMLEVDENDEIIDRIAESTNGYGRSLDFAQIILENLKTAGVQQAHKEDRIVFDSLTGWPGHLVCAEGRYTQGEGDEVVQRRAGIFIGPEFGTVSRPDLVEAAREAAEAGFDVLVACAFNYDAHTTEFERLGRVPVLKARMNADLHMADDLKNTGKGNLFVIFGEPDITVASEEWLVNSSGSRVAPFDIFKLVSGLDSLAEINRLGSEDLRTYAAISCRGEIWDYLADATGGNVDSGEHRGRPGETYDRGVSTVSWSCAGITGGTRNISGLVRKAGPDAERGLRALVERLCRDQQDAQRADAVSLHSPLTTNHYAQVRVNGVDVFHPNSGEVRSHGPDGIACWFIDTDYNEEAFFVRHAYFLGASDPYKSLRTTLKAEIDAEAWESLRSDVSRPFEKPESGRIAVKVINHLGDEVMKVFRV